METLMATSLCVGVLGAIFLPHEFNRLTTVAATRTLRCWSLDDGHVVAALVESLALHWDSVPREKYVQWHAGKCSGPLPRPLRLSEEAQWLTLDPLGKRIFVGYDNGMLKSFLMVDAEPEVAVLGNVPGLSEVLCTPTGKSLLTAGERGLELWDIQFDGRAWLKTSRLLAAGKVNCLAISSCARAVFAGITTTEGIRLVEIDLQSGTEVSLLKLPEPLGRLLASADGKRLAATHGSCEISLFQRASYRSSWQPVDFPGLYTIGMSLVSLSPDSSLLITCDRLSPTLLIWDLESKTVRRSLDAPMDYLYGCAFLDASHVIRWGFKPNLNDALLLPQDEVQVIEL